MEFIKTKSSYVERKKHSLTKDGTIYERDMSTIGGINWFAPNQTPIYSSGNFVISIGNTVPTKHKIEKNNWVSNGNTTVWTLDNIDTLLTDNDDTANETNITLKRDFFRLQDFAYYGSLSDYIQNSINHIINTFPGEIYAPYTVKDNKIYGYNVEYTAKTFDGFSVFNLGERNLNGELINEGYLYSISNPFNLNFHNPIPTVNTENVEKYFFYQNNSKNYVLIKKDGTIIDFNDLTVVFQGVDDEPCKGNAICYITVKKENEILFEFAAYLGNKHNIYYLTKSQYLGIHIRPKESLYTSFINSLNIFENYLLDKKESKDGENFYYIATFEILKDEGLTYSKILEDFILTVDEGGYNLNINSASFQKYVSRLSQIAAYYDENFTDNLYRKMTHESIKNFDWTLNSEIDDEEDRIPGANKMSNLIHLFGREFDEIKSYIDNIKYINVITYNERNNLPDYFLTDAVELNGWDVNTICPFHLDEYYYNTDNEKINISTNSAENEVKNIVKVNDNTYHLYRNFTQNVSYCGYSNIKPYQYNSCIKNGSFIYCNGDKLTEEQNNNKYNFYKYDKKRIMPYFSNETYSIIDIYNEFLKRLSLNSKSLFKTKGTINGIERILAMFGFKSQRWIDSLGNKVQQRSFCSGSVIYKTDVLDKADYEIKEYTAFSNGIFDSFSEKLDDTWINWYNSLKLLPFDETNAYDGLPTISENVYQNEKLIGRNLYPFFDNNIDGNPYYQMNGGWLSKGAYAFDKNNNIVLEENGDVKNNTLYTNTHAEIHSVSNFEEIKNFNQDNMNDGDIMYIENLQDEYIVIDGTDIYKLEEEIVNDTTYKYFIYNATPMKTQIGDIIFYNKLVLFNPNYQESNRQVIDLTQLNDNIDVKIYISGTVNSELELLMTDGTYELLNRHIVYFIKQNNNYKFISYGENEDYKLNDVSGKSFTQYFILHNHENCHFYDRSYGWEQLTDNDTRYYKVNMIIEKDKGNNPHIGHSKYDLGYEYISYFNYLFKYILENDLVNTDCFSTESVNQHLDIMSQLGFNSLTKIDENGNKLDYDIYNDKKIHSFCNKLNSNDISSDMINNTIYFRKNSQQIGNINNNITKEKYGKDYHLNNISRDGNNDNKYISNIKSTSVSGTNGNVIVSGLSSNDILHQIINTKRVDIIFNMHSKENEKYSFKAMEEKKYIDDVILPYMEQMLPSNIICKIKYKYE